MDTSKSFDLSQIIGQLAANPQVAGAILKLMGAGSPREDEEHAVEGNVREPAEPAAEQVIATAEDTAHRDSKRQILCAIKPYVSEHRRDMIEKILHAGDLISLVKPSHT